MVHDKCINLSLTFIVYIFCFGSVVSQQYDFDDMDFDTLATLIIAFIYIFVLVPMFGYLSTQIATEALNEAKLAFF